MNYKQYLLIKLAEECSELSQAAIKCSLFGYSSKDPREENGNTNLEKMLLESLDLQAVAQLLEEFSEEVFNPETFSPEGYIEYKKAQLKYYWLISQEKNKQ